MGLKYAWKALALNIFKLWGEMGAGNKLYGVRLGPGWAL